MSIGVSALTCPKLLPLEAVEVIVTPLAGMFTVLLAGLGLDHPE
jgi:hypothetical protein